MKKRGHFSAGAPSSKDRPATLSARALAMPLAMTTTSATSMTRAEELTPMSSSSLGVSPVPCTSTSLELPPPHQSFDLKEEILRERIERKRAQVQERCPSMWTKSFYSSMGTKMTEMEEIEWSPTPPVGVSSSFSSFSLRSAPLRMLTSDANRSTEEERNRLETNLRRRDGEGGVKSSTTPTPMRTAIEPTNHHSPSNPFLMSLTPFVSKGASSFHPSFPSENTLQRSGHAETPHETQNHTTSRDASPKEFRKDSHHHRHHPISLRDIAVDPPFHHGPTPPSFSPTQQASGVLSTPAGPPSSSSPLSISCSMTSSPFLSPGGPQATSVLHPAGGGTAYAASSSSTTTNSGPPPPSERRPDPHPGSTQEPFSHEPRTQTAASSSFHAVSSSSSSFSTSYRRGSGAGPACSAVPSMGSPWTSSTAAGDSAMPVSTNTGGAAKEWNGALPAVPQLSGTDDRVGHPTRPAIVASLSPSPSPLTRPTVLHPPSTITTTTTPLAPQAHQVIPPRGFPTDTKSSSSPSPSPQPPFSPPSPAVVFLTNPLEKRAHVDTRSSSILHPHHKEKKIASQRSTDRIESPAEWRTSGTTTSSSPRHPQKEEAVVPRMFTEGPSVVNERMSSTTSTTTSSQGRSQSKLLSFVQRHPWIEPAPLLHPPGPGGRSVKEGSTTSTTVTSSEPAKKSDDSARKRDSTTHDRWTSVVKVKRERFGTGSSTRAFFNSSAPPPPPPSLVGSTLDTTCTASVGPSLSLSPYVLDDRGASHTWDGKRGGRGGPGARPTPPLHDRAANRIVSSPSPHLHDAHASAAAPPPPPLLASSRMAVTGGGGGHPTEEKEPHAVDVRARAGPLRQWERESLAVSMEKMKTPTRKSIRKPGERSSPLPPGGYPTEKPKETAPQETDTKRSEKSSASLWYASPSDPSTNPPVTPSNVPFAPLEGKHRDGGGAFVASSIPITTHPASPLALLEELPSPISSGFHEGTPSPSFFSPPAREMADWVWCAVSNHPMPVETATTTTTTNAALLFDVEESRSHTRDHHHSEKKKAQEEWRKGEDAAPLALTPRRPSSGDSPLWREGPRRSWSTHSSATSMEKASLREEPRLTVESPRATASQGKDPSTPLPSSPSHPSWASISISSLSSSSSRFQEAAASASRSPSMKVKSNAPPHLLTGKVTTAEAEGLKQHQKMQEEKKKHRTGASPFSFISSPSFLEPLSGVPGAVVEDDGALSRPTKPHSKEEEDDSYHHHHQTYATEGSHCLTHKEDRGSCVSTSTPMMTNTITISTTISPPPSFLVFPAPSSSSSFPLSLRLESTVETEKKLSPRRSETTEATQAAVATATAALLSKQRSLTPPLPEDPRYAEGVGDKREEIVAGDDGIPDLYPYRSTRTITRDDSEEAHILTAGREKEWGALYERNEEDTRKTWGSISSFSSADSDALDRMRQRSKELVEKKRKERAVKHRNPPYDRRYRTGGGGAMQSISSSVKEWEREHTPYASTSFTSSPPRSCRKHRESPSPGNTITRIQRAPSPEYEERTPRDMQKKSLHKEGHSIQSEKSKLMMEDEADEDEAFLADMYRESHRLLEERRPSVWPSSSDDGDASREEDDTPLPETKAWGRWEGRQMDSDTEEEEESSRECPLSSYRREYRDNSSSSSTVSSHHRRRRTPSPPLQLQTKTTTKDMKPEGWRKYPQERRYREVEEKYHFHETATLRSSPRGRMQKEDKEEGEERETTDEKTPRRRVEPPPYSYDRLAPRSLPSTGWRDRTTRTERSSFMEAPPLQDFVNREGERRIPYEDVVSTSHRPPRSQPHYSPSTRDEPIHKRKGHYNNNDEEEEMKKEECKEHYGSTFQPSSLSVYHI